MSLTERAIVIPIRDEPEAPMEEDNE